MIKHAALGIVALLGLAGAAVAADLPTKKSPPPPVIAPPPFSWTGCYIGANVGGGWADNHAGLLVPGDTGSQSFYNPALLAGAYPATMSYSQSGALGGGQVGCNYQVSSFVIGAEGDIDWAHVSGATSVSNSGIAGFAPFQGSAGSTLDWLGTVRARLGFTPVDRWLVYATGGLAFGGVRDTYSNAFAATNDLFTSNVTTTKTGWTLGAGVEWAFLNNWSVKAEYLYYDLGPSTDITVPGGRDTALVAAGTIKPLSNKFTETGDIVRIGLNYKFF